MSNTHSRSVYLPVYQQLDALVLRRDGLSSGVKGELRASVQRACICNGIVDTVEFGAS